MASVGNYLVNPAGACIKVMAPFSSGLCNHGKVETKKRITSQTSTLQETNLKTTKTWVEIHKNSPKTTGELKYRDIVTTFPNPKLLAFYVFIVSLL